MEDYTNAVWFGSQLAFDFIFSWWGLGMGVLSFGLGVYLRKSSNKKEEQSKKSPKKITVKRRRLKKNVK